MAYNPNSIWSGKKKEYTYNPQPSLPSTASTPVTKAIIEPSPSSSLEPQLNISAPSEQPANNGESFFHRHGLVFFSIGLLFIFGGVAAAAYYLRPVEKPNVSITFTQSSTILVGVPVTLSIATMNNSNVTLTGAVLTVVLPDGMSFVGDDQSERAKEYPLSDVPTGTAITQSSTIVATANPDTQQLISVKLTYGSAGTAQTEFETDGKENILIGDSAIGLSYTAPSSIFSGQSFPITIRYQNNTLQEIADAQIQMNYPPAFTFSSSTIKTATNTANLWDVGTLAVGQSGSFTITGTIIGPQQTQYQMIGSALINTLGQNYTANTQPLDFALVESPLSLSIIPNNSAQYISSAGDGLNYTLQYTNNSNITFAGVNISANLIGQMFNLSSLQTDGAFNSKSNTITWYAANTPGLASLAPGQSGQVTFSVGTQKTFPIRLLSDKNYILKVIGTIQSQTVLPNAAGSSTISIVTLENKVGGETALSSKGYFKSGPYPPKVNQPTTYDITWTIVNYATDIQNVTVSAYLQSGSTFMGTPSSSISSTPSYDPSTGLITWTIPFIAADTGIADAPVQTTFEVSNTPAVNQVGEDVTLLGKTSMAATDGFTGQSLTATVQPVTTALPDDPAYSSGEHHVIQ